MCSSDLMVENKQSNIKAILDTDLEKLLKETKQYNAFVDGELQCAYCGTTITIDNLSIILPIIKEGHTTLNFCCDNAVCLAKFRKDHE